MWDFDRTSQFSTKEETRNREQKTRNEEHHQMRPFIHLISLFVLVCLPGLYFLFTDISLALLNLYPELATMKDKKNNNETALHVLARKPSAMDSTKQLKNWKLCVNSCRFFQTIHTTL